jgi:hypothetical protein
MRHHLIPGSVAALLAATGLAAAQQEPVPVPADTASTQSGGFSLTTGADYSTGKYGGTASTDMLYVPLTGAYEMDKWLFKLTVPYIRVTGPGNVVRGVGRIKNKAAAPGNATTTQSGLGDVVAGVTRNLIDVTSSGTLVDLTGKIKFGTADAGKALGTGENDYGAQIDVTQRVTAALSAFGSVGYKFVGSPTGAELKNVVYGEGGAAVKLGAGLGLGAIFHASQAPSPASGPERDITGYLTQQLSERWKLQIYGDHGFASGSPDWGGGAMASFKF